MPDWRATEATKERHTTGVDDVPVVQLRLFASAREAAGHGRVEASGRTVADVLEQAVSRFGPAFAAVASTARVWVNGQPAEATMPLRPADEVAVLPPVSGGAGR